MMVFEHAWEEKANQGNYDWTTKTQIIDSVVGEGGIYELERPRLRANIIEIFISQ